MNRSRPERRALPWLVAAALCTGMPAAMAQTAVTPVTTPVATPTLLIVSPQRVVESDADFAGGCWVKLYDGEAYVGAQLTLIGPIDLPAMTRAGSPWRDWDSMVVGPQAQATIYDAEGFEQHSATLHPWQRIPDMTAAGFGQLRDIESARVKCSAS